MAVTFDETLKPTTEEEFKQWFSAKFEFEQQRYSVYYDQVVQSLKERFIESSFWQGISERLYNWDGEYYTKKGVHLFSNFEPPIVWTKSLDSLLNKTYRKDILRNDSFPYPPKDGWIDQNSWFERIHDIIRTMFVVRYLDGVKFLDHKMSELAQETGVDYMCSYEAHDDGYYAAHAAVSMRLPILTHDWENVDQTVQIEMQITTELQEEIKQLLHKYYEKNRKEIIPDDYKWQWDYHNDQFIPSYMGHIAHYIEGMIVEIRDKQL